MKNVTTVFTIVYFSLYSISSWLKLIRFDTIQSGSIASYLHFKWQVVKNLKKKTFLINVLTCLCWNNSFNYSIGGARASPLIDWQLTTVGQNGTIVKYTLLCALYTGKGLNTFYCSSKWEGPLWPETPQMCKPSSMLCSAVIAPCYSGSRGSYCHLACTPPQWKCSLQ